MEQIIDTTFDIYVKFLNKVQGQNGNIGNDPVASALAATKLTKIAVGQGNLTTGQPDLGTGETEPAE